MSLLNLFCVNVGSDLVGACANLYYCIGSVFVSMCPANIERNGGRRLSVKDVSLKLVSHACGGARAIKVAARSCAAQPVQHRD